METAEDIKKYIAVAQSLSIEAKNNLEGSETEKDASLQQMGALLASNCQKLCIGPSFHFYGSERSADCNKEDMYKSEESRSAADDNDDDDNDEFETVVYNGPDAPYEIVEEANHQNKNISPEVKLKLMNAKLAQTSAELGGLLTPHFFLQSPDGSSVDSPSEELRRASNNGSEKRNPKCPFSFPTVNQETSEFHVDDTAHQLQRVEILDDNPDDEDEATLELYDQIGSHLTTELMQHPTLSVLGRQWLGMSSNVEWSKKYIESRGFCLGVQPGNFFKDASKPYFYVKLPHRSNYEVIVTNNNQVPCDLDLHVNGQHVAALRLLAGTTRSVDGPQYSEHAFKLFRAKDAPPDKKVTEGAKVNGIVKAVFTPCKVGNSRLRAASEPLRPTTRMTDFLDILDDSNEEKKQRSFTTAGIEEDKTERSLDISRVAEGVTLLQGKKKRKNYVLAPDMETDPSKRMTLQLRLIASLDEEVDTTEGEVYDLEPPPLPTRK